MLEAYSYSHIVKPQRHNFPLIFVTDDLGQYLAQMTKGLFRGKNVRFWAKKRNFDGMDLLGTSSLGRHQDYGPKYLAVFWPKSLCRRSNNIPLTCWKHRPAGSKWAARAKKCLVCTKMLCLELRFCQLGITRPWTQPEKVRFMSKGSSQGVIVFFRNIS